MLTSWATSAITSQSTDDGRRGIGQKISCADPARGGHLGTYYSLVPLRNGAPQAGEVW